jgi:spore maturation protein CgeB
MWNTDTRAKISKYKHLFILIKSCDYYFAVDTKTIPQWKKINPNTFWLPQGLQNEVYSKPGKITDEERARYSCDISFAGGLKVSAHKHRNQYLKAIEQMDVELKLWGCRGNPLVYNEEHNKMVSQSKINLCCSAFPGNGQYTSVRNYKILGAGGFALELYREGINEIFPENIIKCYVDSEDLKEKVRYWLDHDEERRQIADMVYKWVHENATYTHRIRDALRYMGMT